MPDANISLDRIAALIRKIAAKKTKHIFLAILLLLSSSALAEETCCHRIVQVTPIYNPVTGQMAKVIMTAFGNAFRNVGLDDCPLRVEVTTRTKFVSGDFSVSPPDFSTSFPIDAEYLFIGQLSFQGTGAGEEATGKWTLRVELIDPHHAATLESRQISWEGRSKDYQRGASAHEPAYNYPKALGLAFTALDDLIHGYERLPEQAKVDPEDDPVAAEEELTVKLDDVKSTKYGESQPWQMVLVKVKHGEILNGDYQGNGNYAYEVGSGSIDVKYRAPEECQGVTEEVTVYNVCDTDPGPAGNLRPSREIETGEFEIFCVSGKVFVRLNDRYGKGCDALWRLQTEKVEIEFQVNPTDDPCVYDLEQKSTKSANYQTQCVYSEEPECTWREAGHHGMRFLYGSGFGTPGLDFNKNPDKPLSIVLEGYHIDTSSRKICPDRESSGVLRRDNWRPMHNNYWPLQDRHSETFGIFTYSLDIEQDEAEKARERCFGK